MSLARAFTTRRFKNQDEGTSGRPNSNKASHGSIRSRISGPVELISTTNMLSYTAPDLFPLSTTTTNSSPRSVDDMFDSAPVSAWTPPTSPEAESPKRASRKPNHLSSYFSPPSVNTGKVDVPSATKRVSSQAKRATDDTLSRARSASHLSQQSQRTVSGKGSFTFSRLSSASTSTSNSSVQAVTATTVTSPTAVSYAAHLQHRKEFSQSQHPFGMELAQVTEIAEEYGVDSQLLVVDAEEVELVSRGLVKVKAEDYLSDVQSLFASFFGDALPPAPALWI